MSVEDLFGSSDEDDAAGARLAAMAAMAAMGPQGVAAPAAGRGARPEHRPSMPIARPRRGCAGHPPPPITVGTLGLSRRLR